MQVLVLLQQQETVFKHFACNWKVPPSCNVKDFDVKRERMYDTQSSIITGSVALSSIISAIVEASSI